MKRKALVLVSFLLIAWLLGCATPTTVGYAPNATMVLPSFSSKTSVAKENLVAESPTLSMDVLLGKTYIGTNTGKMSSIGIKLVVLSVQGKEGRGKMAFYPQFKGDVARMGEHEATFRILDDGRLEAHVYRPAADGKGGTSFFFEIKNDGKTLETKLGGILKEDNIKKWW